MKTPTSIEQAIPSYGTHVLDGLEDRYFADCVALVASEAWALVESEFRKPPAAVAVPESMEEAAIRAQLDALPATRSVFGIGGGSACDAAKLYAHLHGAHLILLPSVLSADAPFTKSIAVRVDNRVRYVGSVLPDHLLIDFDLLRKAPAKLNRAGVADVLSIYTALYDWRLAAEVRAERYDGLIAQEAQALLERLLASADAFRDCTDEGLRLLAELYVGEVELCERWGGSRPEEGSEHFLGYCLEWFTGRGFIHGELIGFCVVATALHQGQDARHVMDFLDRVGVRFRPAEFALDPGEIHNALVRLPGFLEMETQLPYGIYHHTGMDAKAADGLLDRLADLGVV